MKSWAITIHLLSWLVGGTAFLVLALTDHWVAMWTCVVAGFSGLLSSLASLPIALVRVLNSRGEPLHARLQYGVVAFMSGAVLGAFVLVGVMTEGRH